MCVEEDSTGDGIYVVMAGLVKSSYQTPDGDTQVWLTLSDCPERQSKKVNEAAHLALVNKQACACLE